MIKSCWLVLGVLAFADVSHAGALRRGVSMQVKPETIWFQDRAKLARWQALKKAGDASALAAYRDGLLQAREAWQFTKPLMIRIIGIEPKAHLVRVELRSEGRLQGSRWMLDEGALVR